MMDSSYSVLGGSVDGDVQAGPFPHIVADPCLASALYAQMQTDFPSFDRFVSGLGAFASNQAIRIPASAVLGSTEFSPQWREFFAYHTSAAFWADILRVFGSSIRETYPKLEARSGKSFDDWIVKRRGTGGGADLYLDILFVINTPVTATSSVRPAHIDADDKLFAGLFYMRTDDDTTSGGDLELYDFAGRPPRFAGSYAPKESIKQERLISYKANRFVGFLNSPGSVHGVTPRPETPHVRRYINFVACTPQPIFKREQLSLIQQTRHYLGRKWNSLWTHTAKGIDLQE